MSKDISRIRLTAGRVEAFKCPADKSQAFLWDTEAPSLMLRVTPTGRKTFAFESRLKGATIRITIGTASDWSLEQARKRAAEYKQQVDAGQDPRELEKAKVAEKAAQAAEALARATTVGDLWPTYLVEGKPKRRDEFKPRYLKDLHLMCSPGGENKVRGKGKTRPGPLFPLLSLPLIEINEDTLKAWHDKEAKTGKHQAARALMMFRGFLRWCATKPAYRGLVDANAGKAPALLASLPSMKRRTDSLEAAQVSGWWSGVEQLASLALDRLQLGLEAVLRAVRFIGDHDDVAAIREHREGGRLFVPPSKTILLLGWPCWDSRCRSAPSALGRLPTSSSAVEKAQRMRRTL